ncbi:snRNA-activating protein complex subunit 3-like isoform X1 [Dinothrombium tinctorium]|uniref:snRNA-activating protein complex subunit 3 n=1 Tax=Dinothrombium tinctorium TaxID=1965070 RepID=A0A3S4RFR6_9ACAR|nr:snRNA-activating protein complex subunit 3-like isoform X1 [Dinothrombium tinctorium]
MESIHKSEYRVWINQKRINVKQFVEEWRSIGVENELSFTDDNLLQKASEEFKSERTSVDELGQILSQAVDDCDPSKLTVDGENDAIYTCYDRTVDDFEIPDDLNLETLRLQKEHLKRCKTDNTYRSAFNSSLKYRMNPIAAKNDAKTMKDSERQNELVSDLCAILIVQIFRPMLSKEGYGEKQRTPSLIADREIMVLSSQYLTELRDKYHCVSDIASLGDCSDNPSLSKTKSAGDIYKSGFFFIGNIFYNDMRDNSNIDYSQIIIEWSQEAGRGIGPFKSANMESTKFEDLEIQLGYPYVYVHQGNCEHLLVFTDLRLFVPQSDSRCLKDYPKILATNKRIPIKCGGCNLNTAKWLTRGNKRLPEEQFFFCDTCFRSFNYDENNKKIGEFQAYSFLDRTAVL